MEKQLTHRDNQIAANQNQAPAASHWSDRLDLIKEKLAPTATPAEFDLFIYMARKYDLDPFLRQIFLVKYGTYPAQIFAGRDGFLDIAHRSGNFDGMATTFGTESGELYAETTVYNKTMSRPIVNRAYFSEYFRDSESGKNNLWKSKPKTMIQKVAESQALRKAFRISGLYDPDEITEQPHAEEKVLNAEPATPRTTAPTANGITPQDVPEDIRTAAKKLNWKWNDLKTFWINCNKTASTARRGLIKSFFPEVLPFDQNLVPEDIENLFNFCVKHDWKLDEIYASEYWQVFKTGFLTDNGSGKNDY